MNQGGGLAGLEWRQRSIRIHSTVGTMCSYWVWRMTRIPRPAQPRCRMNTERPASGPGSGPHQDLLGTTYVHSTCTCRWQGFLLDLAINTWAWNLEPHWPPVSLCTMILRYQPRGHIGGESLSPGRQVPSPSRDSSERTFHCPALRCTDLPR